MERELEERGGVRELQARQGSSVFSQPRLHDPCAWPSEVGFLSGLFQLKPATPASTALAVLPMSYAPRCPGAQVPKYPGTYLGRSQGRRVSHSCQFSVDG